MILRKTGLIVFSLGFSLSSYATNLKPLMKSDINTTGPYCAKIIITNLIKTANNKAVTINRLESTINQFQKDTQRNKMAFSSQYEIPVDARIAPHHDFTFSLSKVYLPSESSNRIHNLRKMNFDKMSCGNIYFITLLNGNTQNEVSLKAVINSVPFNSQSELEYLSNELKKSHSKLKGQKLASILLKYPFLVAKSVMNLKVHADDLNQIVTGPKKLREALSSHINKIHAIIK